MSKKSSPKSVSTIVDALRKSEEFISGFEEDDGTQGAKGQQNITRTLKLLRKAIKVAVFEATDKIIIEIDGGMVSEVYTNLAQVEVLVVDRDAEKVGEPAHRDDWFAPEPIGTASNEIQKIAGL